MEATHKTHEKSMTHSIKFLAVLTSMILSTLIFTSCPDNPDGPIDNATQGEWYVSPSGFASSSDFQEIIKAINNHELLSDYGKIGKHYAEIDEFIMSDGLYSDWEANKGRLRFWIKQNPVQIIHIVDDLTAEFYNAMLYTDLGENNRGGGLRLWHFDAGRYFGEMAYYADAPSYLIYTKRNNTYVFSNGEVYIMKADGLQGNSGVWKKFTPKF